MKYDVLYALKDRLNQEYGKNTAKKYYFAVQSLLDSLDFNTAEDIPLEEIERRMAGIRNRNDFSAAKRGLLILQECFPDLQLPGEDIFQRHSQKKRNYKKRQFEPLQLDSVKRKINALPDKRLKLAYRLMLASGTRVSETASLFPEDLTVNGQSIQVEIRNGKGGKPRTVVSLPDPYLTRELPQFVASTVPGTPVFYSATHMQNEAAAHGFECHDLRRAFSKEYREYRKTSAPDIYTANGQLMEAMGHTDFRTTKKYLRRKIQ